MKPSPILYDQTQALYLVPENTGAVFQGYYCIHATPPAFNQTPRKAGDHAYIGIPYYSKISYLILFIIND